MGVGEVMPDPTISDVLAGVTALLGPRDLTQREFADWVAGAVDGGPDGDGIFPLTDSTGFVRSYPSIPKIASLLGIDIGGDPTTGGGTDGSPPAVLPIRLVGALGFDLAAGLGETVAEILGVPRGAAPTVTPAGVVVIAGDEHSGWRLVRGTGTAGTGSLTVSVAAAGGISAVADLAIAAAPTVASVLGTIAVAEKSGAALADYQVSVTLPWKAGMAADFANVVFRDQPSGAVLVPYIVPESVVAGTTCKLWLKLPAIGASATRTLDYGTCATTLPRSTARGRRVFDFFDDFEVGWDPSLWAAHTEGKGGEWAGYVDHWRFVAPTVLISGGKFNQGSVGDGAYFYGGRDDGQGVDGLIFKYSYAGVYTDSFPGVSHNNGLSVRANGNILTCSAGTVVTGLSGQSVVAEITPQGKKVRTWDFGDKLYFGAAPNGCYRNEIAGGFEFIVMQGATSRLVAQILRCMDDGTWSISPESYELNIAKVPQVRGQNVWYQDGILQLVTDDVSPSGSYSADAYGTVLRWRLEADGTGTPIDSWRHLPGGEREAITFDGTNWLFSTHAGTLNRLVIDSTRSGRVMTAGVAGQKVANLARAAFAGSYAVSWRMATIGASPQFGLADSFTAETGMVVLEVRASTSMSSRRQNGAAVNVTTYAAANDVANYHTYEIQKRPTSATFVRDGVTLATETAGVPDMPLYLRFSANALDGSGGSCVLACDQVFVRKLAGAEPTVTVN